MPSRLDTRDRYGVLPSWRAHSRSMMPAIEKLMPKEFPAFVVVGGLGFLVDAATLIALIDGLGWGLYTARAGSFAVAVTATWWLNRTFAFPAPKTLDKRTEYFRYLAVQLGGMCINFVVYAALTWLSPFMADYPVVALAAGSALALFFNFAGARLFVFMGASQPAR